jgi:cyclic pyranopterin phosphate synthase
VPLSRTDVLTEKNFLPVGEVLQRLREKDNLIPQPARRVGHGPAKYYLLERTGALVGFIGAMTNLDFCENCNKVRLTRRRENPPVSWEPWRGRPANFAARRS